MLVACTLAVVEECPKAAAVQMIQDCQQKALVELEGGRKLSRGLPARLVQSELYLSFK